MIEALISLIQNILSPLQWSLNWIHVLEISFIVLILFVFYQKFIKNTQAEKLVKGIFFLIFAWIFSEILILIDLKILGVFLKSLVTLISLSLIVIFQPELRKFLGYLGQPGFIRRTFCCIFYIFDVYYGYIKFLRYLKWLFLIINYGNNL